MNINNWAYKILSSPHLEDKLTAPVEIIDDRSFMGKIPQIPARSKKLKFTYEKVEFPRSYESDTNRGLALHYFANHELLALELMALAILKFQDAPHDFRCGLVHSIKDEQNHFKAYLARMQELSIEFGDLPVNNFFWSSISEMKSPESYVAAMSLTLEQANLDHTLYYKDAFAKVGDLKSAEILQKIHEDEIRHVRFGNHWFEEFRPGNLGFWDEYESLLPDSLSPARAKGKSFYVEPRLRAGFSQEFIDELKAFSRSKGRLPVVYEFNPGCEEFLQDQHYQKPKFMNAMERDLSSLLMFIARDGDIVLTPEQPSSAFINYWINLGFPGVEFCKQIPDSRKMKSFHPWGKLPPHRDDALGVKNGFEFLYSKEFSAKLDHRIRQSIESTWINPEDHRLVSHEKVDVINFAKTLFASGFGDLVIKGNLGASGRGHRKIRESDLDSKNLNEWLENKLEVGPVVIEPWFERIADFSIQLDLRPGSKKRIVGVTRLLTSITGQYQGHLLRGLHAGIEPNILRKVYEKNLNGLLKQVGEIVMDNLNACEFDGVAGIDCFLYEQNGQIYLRPVCEINPRMTMGYIALEIEKYFKQGQTWIWRHSSVKNISTKKLNHLIARDRSDLIPTNEIKPGSEFLSWVEPLHLYRTGRTKVLKNSEEKLEGYISK